MKYYDDDYDAEEAYPMKDDTVSRPEIQLESLRGLDWLLALILAGVTGGLLTLWAFPGLSPDAWNDAAIGAGLRPMEAIFPGFWNAIARGIYSLSGVATGTLLLKLLGRLFAGMTVGLVYLLLRQVLSITIRVRLQFSGRRFLVVRGVAVLGALFFACSDPVWRAGQAFTPPLLLLFMTVLVLTLFFGFLMSGGMRQIYLSMFILGLLSAETPMGLFLLALIWGVFLLALRHGAVASDSPIFNPIVRQSSKWHLTFLYAIGLVFGIAINCTTFIMFDGLAVFEKVGADVPLLYVTRWWMQFIHAASGLGWALSIGVGMLPFVVLAVLLPRAVDEEQFLPYHMGAVFFVAGALSFAQLAELPPLWFWTWSRAATVDSPYFLLVLMLFSAAAVVFALAVMAVDICCRDHKRLAMQRFAELKEETGASAEVDETRDVKPLGAGARVVLTIVPVLLLAGVVPGRQLTQTRKMLGIIDDYVKEVLAECGGVQWIFTNGEFDPILELESAAVVPPGKSSLRALAMMRYSVSANSPREQYIRTHGVALDDGESLELLKLGAPVALHTWATSRPDLMPQVAIQLGFEIWKKRLHTELPPCSGLVSRPVGMSEEDRVRGVEAANALAERVLAVYNEGGPTKSAGRKINSLFRIVQWHIARLATMRAEREDHAGLKDLALRDKALADELDLKNVSLQELREGLKKTERLTVLAITPHRGLLMALDQADFTQARQYAELILKSEPDNFNANFAMGMSYYVQKQWTRAEEYFRRYLTKKDVEPAVFNNLAIICMETDRYDEALMFAEKALKLLPGSGEVKETIADIKRKRDEAAKAKNAAAAKPADVPPVPLATTNAPAQAVAAAPSGAEKPLDVYAIFGEGMSHVQKREWNQAVEKLMRCVELEPDNPLFLTSLAKALFYKGRYDDALKHAQKALELQPKSGEAKDLINQIKKAKNSQKKTKKGEKTPKQTATPAPADAPAKEDEETLKAVAPSASENM